MQEKLILKEIIQNIVNECTRWLKLATIEIQDAQLKNKKIIVIVNNR